MKVKITKGKHWYKDKVGEIFEVTGTLNDDGKYSTTQESTDELLKTEVDQGVVGYFINSKHCEKVKEMSKFNIGSKVIVRDGTYDDGRTGEIIERGSMYLWRIRYDSDGSTELFCECDLELVEPQWMSKEAALHLALDGAKVTNETNTDKCYVYFDGKDFMFYNGNYDKTEKAMLYGSQWKLWTPPTPPNPKFAVDDFVVEDDGDYWRVLGSEYVDGTWVYSLTQTNRENIDDCYECDESELSMA